MEGIRPLSQEVTPIQGGGSNNGQGKWKSNIAMLEKRERNKKRQFFSLQYCG